MEFVHHPVNNLWTDYTVNSVAEESISNIEELLSKWVNPPKDKSVETFKSYSTYYVTFVPEAYTEKSSRIRDNLTLIPEKSSDAYYSSIEIIRTLFCIQSHFLIISNRTDENSSIAKNSSYILSIVYSAAAAIQFPYPIFIQTSVRDEASFRGFWYSPTRTISYTSRPESLTNENFMSHSSIIKMFKDTFGTKVNKYSSSIRRFFCYQLSNSKTMPSKFYYSPRRFPIDKIYIFSQYLELTDFSKSPNILSAPDLAIFINLPVYSSKIEKENGLYNFMEKLFDSQTAPTMRQTLKDGVLRSIEPEVTKIVQDLFERVKTQKNEFEIPSIFAKPDKLKAAPSHSLLNELSIQFSQTSTLIQVIGIWRRFLQEIRNYFEDNQIIPGISLDGPNLNNCIICQKIEMINWCIKGRDPTCETKKEDQKKLFLLNGKEMIIPESSGISIQTEDQINESIILMARFENDQEQKAIIQSKQLNCDMAAFKRVNPDAIFDDFIRWYSPNDFNEETKSLSLRMSKEGNIWQKLWNEADPKRAGEFTKNKREQAELAFDYLESLEANEVLSQFAPIIIGAAYDDICSRTQMQSLESMAALKDLRNILAQYSAKNSDSFKEFYELNTNMASFITKYASKIEFANYLLSKLPNCYLAVDRLIREGCCPIKLPEEKEAIQKLSFNFTDSYIDIDESTKDTIIRGEGPKIKVRLFVSQRKERFIIGSAVEESFPE